MGCEMAIFSEIKNMMNFDKNKEKIFEKQEKPIGEGVCITQYVYDIRGYSSYKQRGRNVHDS